MPRHGESVVHFPHEMREHLIGLTRLAAQVLEHVLIAFRGDHIHVHRAMLAESPTPAHALVILLKRVRRKERHMITVLEVQPPRADLRLGNQHPRPLVCERHEPILFDVIGVRAGYLQSVGDQLFK